MPNLQGGQKPQPRQENWIFLPNPQDRGLRGFCLFSMGLVVSAFVLTASESRNPGGLLAGRHAGGAVQSGLLGPKTAYAAPGAARTEANSPPRRDRPRPAGPAPPARPPAALGSGGPRARPRPAPADSRPAARPPARPREQRARRPGSAPRAGAAQPRAGGRARGAREAGAARTLLRLGRASKAAPKPAGAPPPLTCVPTTTICGSWMMSAPTVLKTSCSLLITGISASMAPRTRDPRRPAAR